MADDKSSRKTSDMARKIWLAGIGAYGKAFEEGRDMVKGLGGNLSGNTSDAFENLAEKGEKLEMAAKIKGAQLAGKASELRSDIGIEDRIQAMRERLSSGSGDERLDAIEAKLANIEAKLDTLIKVSAKPKRATTTRTKKAPAKTTTKKTTSKK